MYYQKNLQLLVIFLFLANGRGQITYCIPAGNYTYNSTYQTNLQTLLGSLPLNIDDNGFYSASIGQSSDDTVYAMAICRGDIQLDTCRSCVRNITVDVLQSCLLYRQAISWSVLCWFRYSDTYMFGTIDYDNMWMEWGKRNVTNGTQFMSDLGILLSGLIPQAARGGSLRKVAVGNQSTSGIETIYALVQCTPDLSEQNCTSCLTTAAQHLSACCEAKGNVRINMANCDLSYGTAPSINETRILELESTSLALAPTPVSSVDSVPADYVPMPPTPPGRTIILATVLGFAGLTVIALITAFFIRRKGLLGHQVTQTSSSEVQALPRPEANPLPDNRNVKVNDHMALEFEVIKAATNNFSMDSMLGQGGFGVVFRGELPGGRQIAVKKMTIGSSQGEREFRAEVDILAQLKHKNLVTLIGFSIEGEEKLLVYEYASKGSLYDFMSVPIRRSSLDWNTRYNIIEGIVKGIVYLHEDSQLQIVHRDLKPGNILLDENMNSKIADFGLARLFELDRTHCTTNLLFGTLGYIAPEYEELRQFSMKTDVFSFGVILLEIISGQRNGPQGHLISRAWDAWRENTASDFVDPVLRVDTSTSGAILRYIHIGLLCVQPRADDRPTITSIFRMLNSPSMNLPEPSNT